MLDGFHATLMGNLSYHNPSWDDGYVVEYCVGDRVLDCCERKYWATLDDGQPTGINHNSDLKSAADTVIVGR